MEVKKNKINYIVLVQAFAILTVFVGHATRIFSDNGWYFHKATFDSFCQLICQLIYSFHMPLFIFLSGFLFCITRKDDFKILKYIKKRFNRLIIPFFLFGFLYVIPIMKLINHQNKSVLELINDFVILKANYHLWFLMTLFVITCTLTPILRFKLNKLTQTLIFTGLVILNLLEIKDIPMCITYAIKYAIYFYMGYLLANYNHVFKNLTNKAVFYICIIPTWIFFEVLKFRDYDNVHISFFTASFSIILIFAIGIYLSEKSSNLHNNSILCFLASNMFLLYILHEPIMVVILKYFKWGTEYTGTWFASCLFFVTLAFISSMILIKNFIKNKLNKSL